MRTIVDADGIAINGLEITSAGLVQTTAAHTAGIALDDHVITKGYADANYSGGGGWALTGTSTLTGDATIDLGANTLDFLEADATTTGIVNVLQLTHETSATPLDGFGVEMAMWADTEDGIHALRLQHIISDVTTTSIASTFKVAAVSSDTDDQTFLEIIGIGATTSAGAITVGAEGSATGGSAIAIGQAAASVGDQSIGLGKTAIASATGAIAIGNGAEAEVNYAIAIGFDAGDTTGAKGLSSVTIGRSANQGATDIGTSAIAIGYQADSIGATSIAMGFNASAQAVGAIALGDTAISTAINGISIGTGSITGGSNSIAIGSDAGDNLAGADGDFSISIGLNANSWSGTAIGENSIAIGEETISSGVGSIAIGKQATATAQGAIMMGYHTADLTNARTDSFALGWNETIPSMWAEKYTASTVDAGTATVDIPLDSFSTYTYQINIVGGETDATPTMFYTAMWHTGAYRIGAGTATLINGSGNLDVPRLSSAATTENVTTAISVSGNNLRITFTGPDTTPTNMDWRAWVQMTKVVSG